jgi:hypothetical protein
MFAFGATPLDHSASRVSSPDGAGNGPPFTLILVIRDRLPGMLLTAQNLVRSLSSGKVSIRICRSSPVRAEDVDPL